MYDVSWILIIVNYVVRDRGLARVPATFYRREADSRQRGISWPDSLSLALHVPMYQCHCPLTWRLRPVGAKQARSRVFCKREHKHLVLFSTAYFVILKRKFLMLETFWSLFPGGVAGCVRE